MLNLALIVALAAASPAPTPTPKIIAHAVASPKPGPQVVPDAICLTIQRRAGLTTVSRDNPLVYVGNEGALFGAAMKGHVADVDLGNATPPQIEAMAQSRAVLELFGSGPTKQFPQGVVGCIGRYK